MTLKDRLNNDDKFAKSIGAQLIDDNKHYDIDWLWASGDVFNGRNIEDVF